MNLCQVDLAINLMAFHEFPDALVVDGTAGMMALHQRSVLQPGSLHSL